MNYAILSAGDGSRLKEEAVELPKPLVEVNGVPMIDRLLSIFMDNEADSINIITNLQPEIGEFLQKRQEQLGEKLNIVFKKTPSSAHSFYELIPYLQGKDFCLTTVDTIFNPVEFTQYISRFLKDETIDGLMAVTSYVDDESPLYIEIDDEMNILGFHDQDNGRCKYISGGMYALKASALPVVEKGRDEGITRMRNLQRELIAAGLKLKAFPFSMIFDVDHASDIKKADDFLSGLDK